MGRCWIGRALCGGPLFPWADAGWPGGGRAWRGGGAGPGWGGGLRAVKAACHFPEGGGRRKEGKRMQSNAKPCEASMIDSCPG